MSFTYVGNTDIDPAVVTSLGPMGGTAGGCTGLLTISAVVPSDHCLNLTTLQMMCKAVRSNFHICMNIYAGCFPTSFQYAIV